jgi:putative restriction endonuclease
MKQLDDALPKLTAQHRQALQWFAGRAGTEQPWPAPLDGTLLATKAKGIYKPAWSEYALSVRQTLGGPYPDMEPVERADGSWSYRYFQEGEADDVKRHTTNRGMLACLRDGVPVGVMRQTSAKPRVRYRILGLAFVSSWDSGYFVLEGCNAAGVSHAGSVGGPLADRLAHVQRVADAEGVFDPNDVEDARERDLASIVRRRGQARFRAKLLQVYSGRCAITGCNVEEALEAAHVTPYLGTQTNTVQNRILLRADLHTLWDLGLIAVTETNCRLMIATSLEGTSYGYLNGQPVNLPTAPHLAPSATALRQHREWARL